MNKVLSLLIVAAIVGPTCQYRIRRQGSSNKDKDEDQNDSNSFVGLSLTCCSGGGNASSFVLLKLQ